MKDEEYLESKLTSVYVCRFLVRFLSVKAWDGREAILQCKFFSIWYGVLHRFVSSRNDRHRLTKRQLIVEVVDADLLEIAFEAP